MPTHERLDQCETGESYYYPRLFREMPYRTMRDTEPTDRILLWSVQSQGQWRSVSTELSPDTEDNHPILHKDVEAAVQSLKKRKSAGVDSIPAELVQAGAEVSHNNLTIRFGRQGNGKPLRPSPWSSHFPRKATCSQTISLISHSSKVMLKIILNRLKLHVEKITAEEQAGYRTVRSTTEHIFNLRILCAALQLGYQLLMNLLVLVGYCGKSWIFLTPISATKKGLMAPLLLAGFCLRLALLIGKLTVCVL